MAQLEPKPGLIVRYDYVWGQDAPTGQEYGKDRPVCLLAAFEAPDRRTYVALLPITHTPPNSPDKAVEIPAEVKRQLGLDDAPSWIVVSDRNLDLWPTAGLSPLPGKPGRFAYGMLPPSLLDKVRSKFIALAEQNKIQSVRRDEPRGPLKESTGLESRYRTKEERRGKVLDEIARRKGKSKPRGRR